MTFGHITAKGNASRFAVVAFSLLLTCSGATQVASAQGANGGYAGSAFGDQDSLLPPEVVPLDPSTANSMAAQQAQKRAQVGTPDVGQQGQVPGLVGNGGPGGMMSAQDYRKAAFDSLYGQGQLPQNSAPQWQTGVAQYQPVPMNQQQQNNPQNPQGPGQNMSMSPSYAPYQSAGNPLPSQSQTLSGGSKNQPKIRDIRRAGISNTVSALAGFAGGALTAGSLMNPQSPMVGAGIFGLTMTGFGTRNGFRF